MAEQTLTVAGLFADDGFGLRLTEWRRASTIASERGGQLYDELKAGYADSFRTEEEIDDSIEWQLEDEGTLAFINGLDSKAANLNRLRLAAKTDRRVKKAELLR